MAAAAVQGLDAAAPGALELAQVEAALGVSLQVTDKGVIQHIVDRSRTAGNEAFRQRRYKEAAQMYSQAIAGDASDAALFANRSAAHLALGLYEAALWDTQKAAALRPEWAKAHYRLGCALLALSQWGEAAAALARCLELEPGAADVPAKLGAARARVDAETAARAAQAACERRGIAAKLRAARRADQQLAQLNQFKQSMVGPDWELEDLEWRPTYLPAMRLKPLRPETALADPKRHLLTGYVSALADLSHPKQSLRTLEDLPRLQAYQRGITAALQSQPPGASALVLGSGGGLLPLLAAEAGAGEVTAVERSRMLYRMAKQVLEGNRGSGPDPGAADRVRLLDRRLQAVAVRGEALPPDAVLAREQAAAMVAAAAAAGGAAQAAAAEQLSSLQLGDDDVAAWLPGRASLLVTDLLDHAVLGQGLLPALDYAADHLLAQGASVVPAQVAVHACLLELRVGQVSGFDLSALNAYWWHPGAGSERLELGRLAHRRLSAPFRVACLDLQARLDARLAARQAGSGGTDSSGSGGTAGSNQAEGDSDGASGSAPSSSGSEGSGGSTAADAGWELDVTLEVPVVADGHWNAVVFWFELHMEPCGGPAVTSWADGSAAIGRGGSGPGSSEGADAQSTTQCEAQHAARPAGACSWDQAVQYVDSRAVLRGSSVQLRARHDAGQFVFTSSPPQCRPRHALVPRWHFDMVLDSQRNAAYDGAIRRAVARLRNESCTGLLALDLGAGSGLLSMMAARAGADEVVAVEHSQHMCDVGEEATIANGFLGRIMLLDKDARRLDVVRKPDGTPPDLPRQADLLVQEVFDSGCIGEGVLHILAAAQARLLRPGAAMVPAAARVFCQPIQLRTSRVLGWDCSQANRWRWRPDYEGLELGKCRDRWVALAPPQEVFAFDFRDVFPHMAPAEVALDLAFEAEGVFNAVAMWFELQLDEEASLSTSPYADKGLTWQQAVQWMPEVAVRPGQHLQLTARHDTYSISYSHALGEEAAGPAAAGGSTGSSCGRESSSAGADATAVIDRRSSKDCDGGKCNSLVPAAASQSARTAVPLMDPAWKAAFDRLSGLNEQLVKACVQDPLEYRAVARAALALAVRPHDFGVDAQQAAELCVKLMG
ncbi:hypothetical protein ABPG75_005190 [Micractinium tetrahymenae]